MPSTSASPKIKIPPAIPEINFENHSNKKNVCISLAGILASLSLCLAAIITIESVGEAATATLNPVADATLLEVNPNNNSGGQPYVNAGSNQHTNRNRGLFKFDPLVEIPQGSRIRWAQVIFEVVGEPSEQPDNSSQFDLHRMLRAWGEGAETAGAGQGAPATTNEVTWNSPFALTTDSWTAPGASAGTDFVNGISSSQYVYGVANSPYVFDTTPTLVADVQYWLDHPENNFGWILISESESLNLTARRFASREDPDNAPQLNIDFVPPPQIQNAMVSGAQFQFSFDAEAGQGYQVQSSTNLTANSGWQIVTNIAPPLASTNVSMTLPFSAASGFYRVVAP